MDSYTARETLGRSKLGVSYEIKLLENSLKIENFSKI